MSFERTINFKRCHSGAPLVSAQEGFYCVEDGDWGNTTEKALQLFLKDAGYDVDFKQGVRDGGRTRVLFFSRRLLLSLSLAP